MKREKKERKFLLIFLGGAKERERVCLVFWLPFFVILFLLDCFLCRVFCFAQLETWRLGCIAVKKEVAKREKN